MSEILFLTAGTIDFASSRYRGFWPAKYMGNAEVYPLAYALQSGLPLKADTKTIVFQKFAYIPMMKYAHDQGVKVVWDVCDPSWWFDPDKCKDILDLVDMVTAPTVALIEDLFRQYGIDLSYDIIPDSFDPDHYKDVPEQAERKDNQAHLIWFGHQNNRFTLVAHLGELERLALVEGLDVHLTIFDGEPDNRWPNERITIHNKKWTLAGEVEELRKHDLAYLPSYPGRWGKLKSDNKQVHAGYCGLHAYDPEHPKAPLVKMLGWGPDLIDEGWLKDHDAELVAKQWKAVLA
jgi:hypothetical protein